MFSVPGAGSGRPVDDLVELVLADHTRIDRLFEELEGSGDDMARLAALWAELSGVLLAHIAAFEEICQLPLLHTVPDSSLSRQDLSAQKLDVSDAVAGARLQRVGSPQWWLAVRAAHAAADQHISSTEGGPLRRFAQQAPESARQELGRQWNRFMADLSGDRRGGLCPD